MTIPSLEIRCSSLHKIMSKPKSKSELIGDTAKSYLYELLKQNRFGYRKEVDSKETTKGRLCESQAIQNSGLIRGKLYKKCDLPRQSLQIGTHSFLTGECDILDRESSLIVDTKCSWDISTFPICQAEAAQKAGKAGYIYQMAGYMMLYGCERAEIDYWLLPTPEIMFSEWQYENEPELIEQHTTLINSIPLNQRVTSISVMANNDVFNEIKERILACEQAWIELNQQIIQAA